MVAKRAIAEGAMSEVATIKPTTTHKKLSSSTLKMALP
jgi:hypothetical protein